VSLLKNIWRPEDPPRKGPGPHADSGLTERLAELLGRELEELQESESLKQKDSVAAPSAPESAKGQKKDRSGFSGQNSPIQNRSMAGLNETVSGPASAEMDGRLGSEAPNWHGSTAEGSIQLMAAEVLAHLRECEVEIEAKLRGRAEDYAQALETAVGGLDRSAAPPPDKAFEEMGQQFRTEARGWFDEARQELREQLEMSRASLENELKRNHAELLETAQQKIDSIARTSLETGAQSSRQQGQEETEQWLKEQADASRRQTEAAAQNLAAVAEQALERLRSFEERIETGFRNQVEDYRKTVEAAASELEQKGISQANFQHAAEELQRMTEQALDRSTKRIEDHAQQVMTRLSQKLGSVEQSLGGAARAAMEGALLEQQHRLSEAWLEKSRAVADTVAQAGRESQAQLEAARKAAEEEFGNAVREQGRQIVEEVAGQLKNSQLREQLVGDIQGQMEQAARDVMTRSAADLDKQKEAALSGLSGSLHTTAEQFLSDVQQRLNQAGQTWFESAGQSVQREYQSRISQWLDEQTRTTQQKAQEAEQAVARLTDQAATRLELVSREAEASLRDRIGEQQQRWLASALDEARKSGFQQKLIDQSLAEIENRASQLLDQATKQLAEHADNSRATITEEMDASARKLIEGAEASLEKISWQHRGRLAQWWEERNQMARRESEAAAASLAQATEKATSQLRSVQAQMEAEMSSRAREHQTRLLESTMEEMRRSGTIERSVNEASSNLRTKANEILSRSAEQMRDQAEAARLAMDNQAQASRWGLAEELAKKTEQAQSSVEAAGKAVTEDYRRQLSVWWEERTQSVRRESEEAAGAVARSAKQASEQLQAVRQEMEAELQSGMQNYRKGLREAAAEELRRQGFQKDLLDSIAAELDKSARELAERSTKDLQRHVEESLSGLDEKMKTARQNFLDDTQKQMADLSRTSMDMTTSRFHELLTRNVQDLEKEQEEWLQRKRETVWLDINQHTAAAAAKQDSILSGGGAAGRKSGAAAGGILAKALMAASVVALAAALTAVFIRVAPKKVVTTMELRGNPPAGFVAQNPAWGAQERARQLQFANAYWMLAVNDLQHKYAYNTKLPATPPPEFKVDANGLKDTAATRMMYWDKLRQLWTTPGDWKQVTVNNGGDISTAVNWVKTKLTQPQATSPSPSSSSSSSSQN